MCGIFCSISKSSHISPGTVILQRLQARGPDSAGKVSTVYQTASAADLTYLIFYSTVLSLRGEHTVTQPLRSKDERFTLCWNGEAWNIDGSCPAGNDTEAVHSLLSRALLSSQAETETCTESASRLANALSRVAGPYAFVFYDRARGRLFFGRDFLGRRSLLIRTSGDGELILASVSDGDSSAGWSEVDCDGVYYVDLNVANAASATSSSSQRRYGSCVTGSVTYMFTDQLDIADGDTSSVLPPLSLNRSICTISQDPLHIHSPSVTKLETLLQDSLSSRVRNIPDLPRLKKINSGDQQAAKLAILFSGGVDCTVLARLIHDLLPLSDSIDLLNVAFENPRVHKSNSATTPYEQCPDRITGLASFNELQRICPEREWRFVAINIPYADLRLHRQTIVELMYPHNTEMDFSIASALYFAARGAGTPTFRSSSNSDLSSSEATAYTTTARVLLSGLGADELFAGYTRHATAFKRAGLTGLLDELELDVARLGKRNLGRDDRVMSHWGREVRFPYLDENLLAWALGATVREKCGLDEVESNESESSKDGLTLEPGKKVLRCLAWKLGMEDVAREKKRAIQFGARTAKMTGGKVKGTDVLS